MINELEMFYFDNQSEIDDKFASYCFYEGRFEFQDQNKMYNNENVFWEFVENLMDSKRSWG